MWEWPLKHISTIVKNARTGCWLSLHKPYSIYVLDILFSSNPNIHKSSCGLCFWASDPLIDRFYWSISIKGSEVQKQWPDKLLWMLWFDEKSISNVHSLMCSTTMCGRISQFFALKKCISPSSWKSWLIALLGMQIMRIEFIQCHHGKKKTQQKKYNFGVYFYEVFFCWRKNILIDIFSPFFVIIYCTTHFLPPFRELWGRRSHGC